MSETNMFKLLIQNAKQVVQVVKNNERIVVGEAMNKIACIDAIGNDGISIVISRDGLVYDIGEDFIIKDRYKDATFDSKIDAFGKCVIPGLVDPHTHPVWAGDRVREFSMKLAGYSYMDIHESGGGIYYTVEHTKLAPENVLLRILKARLAEMLKCGTTLVEAKSGYGLDTDAEIKLLRILEQAKKETPMDLSTTYCGAHAVPKNLTSAEAKQLIITDSLLKIRQLMLDGELGIDNIDVFCEKGVFDLEQTRSILCAGKEMGLQINFHGDELHPMKAAEMGAEIGAKAISHLEEISEEGIRAMAAKEIVAIILPTTAYMLKLKPPPVRRMIEKKVPVAIGSDFNPNAFCYSMPMIMNLACVLCGMTMEEAMHAATINAAAALGKSETHGSIEKGKFADLVILNTDRWEHLIYQLGAHSSLVDSVIKNGEVVYKNQNSAFLIY